MQRRPTKHGDTKERRKAKVKHEAFLRKMGIRPTNRPKLKGVGFPDLSTAKRGVAATSDTVPATGAKRCLLTEHRWKAGAQESEAIVQETYRKATLSVPLYNKGPVQYAGDGVKDAMATNKRR